MKLKTILPIFPIAAVLLSGCSGNISLSPDQAGQLADRKLTAAPVGTVIYPDDRPSTPDGKHGYVQNNCASCHGVDGMSTPAGGKFAIGDKLWAGKQRPVEEFIFLAYGKSSVPGHQKALRETMSRRQIWDLVAYTRSLAEPLLTKEEMDAVLPVFGANCAVCHGTKGDGDGPLMRNLEPMPANFQTFQRFYDRDDDTLFDHIANGIRWEGMPNFLGKTDVRNKVKFDQKYIRKLVSYVRAFHFSNVATMPSVVGGSESLPTTAPNQDALGLKNQTQPETATPKSTTPHTPSDLPSNPAESVPAPTTPSLQPNDTGTRPIDSPSSPNATTPKH